MNYSYVVGLDVGKKSFDVSFMSLEEELSHRSFANSESGMRALLDWVTSNVPAGSLVMQYYITINSGSVNYRIKSWSNEETG